MRTIPRNHTRKITAIKERATWCEVFSLQNDFAAVECAPSYAWEELERYHFARLTEDADDKWTIHVHGNLWYVLRPKS